MAAWCSLSVVFLLFARESLTAHYDPTWESLDTRPLPDWYDDAKLGIFIHWGVFSVPSFSSEWFWYDWKERALPGLVDFMKKNYPPDFTYADFAPDFRAEFFSPVEWAGLFKESGAKYVVLTSKHHEGFTNWPSIYSFNWNANDTGPNRDLVGELADAVRDYSLKFGLYHSMFEWFHPLYKSDEANGFKTQKFVNSKTLPELYEIVQKYKPEVVWSDGDGDAPAEYWTSQQFLAWLYNDSPVKDTVVVNDRWGKNISCHHGGFFTCADRYNPGKLQTHKWENAMTIDRYSWGYRRNAPLSNYLTIEELLKTFVTTVSCGGNMLMNVGPTSYGKIVPIMEERLKQMGEWLSVNGDAIYGTRPWSHQNDTVSKDVWYTKKKSSTGYTVYAILLQWPKVGTFTLGAPQTTTATVVSLLGYQGNFDWNKGTTGGIDIKIPPIAWNLMPCRWAWVLKLEGISN